MTSPDFQPFSKQNLGLTEDCSGNDGPVDTRKKIMQKIPNTIHFPNDRFTFPSKGQVAPLPGVRAKSQNLRVGNSFEINQRGWQMGAEGVMGAEEDKWAAIYLILDG